MIEIFKVLEEQGRPHIGMILRYEKGRFGRQLALATAGKRRLCGRRGESDRTHILEAELEVFLDLGLLHASKRGPVQPACQSHFVDLSASHRGVRAQTEGYGTANSALCFSQDMQ